MGTISVRKDLACTCMLAGARGGPGRPGGALGGSMACTWPLGASQCWIWLAGIRAAGVSLGRCAGRRRVAMLAFVWPRLPSCDCAVWSGRLGLGAVLEMRDRRGMGVGCESGAGVAPCSSGAISHRMGGHTVVAFSACEAPRLKPSVIDDNDELNEGHAQRLFDT